MPQRLSEEQFLKSFTYAPRIACNLVIENGKGEILLTKRGKPPGVGLWHYPGSFILKDEAIEDCLRRIAKEELGIELPKKNELLGVFDNLQGDPRGHVVDVLYKYQLTETLNIKPVGDTEEVRFFKTLPQDIGFGQKEILKKVGYR